MADWNSFLHESQHVFDLVAAETGNTAVMELDELVLAYHGGHVDEEAVAKKLFDKMDTSRDGVVSIKEWRDWLRNEFDQREEEGPAWITDFLGKVRMNLEGHVDKKAAEEAAAAAKAKEEEEMLWAAAVAKPHQVVVATEIPDDELIPDDKIEACAHAIQTSEAEIVTAVQEILRVANLNIEKVPLGNNMTDLAL